MNRYPDESRQKVLEDCIRETQRFFLESRNAELFKSVLEIVERPLIEITLEKTDGNQKKAAKLLGINRNTLHSKIKKLDIDISKFKFYY